MMNRGTFFSILIIIVTLFDWTQLTIQAQNNVGIGTLTPDSSAILDLVATDKGVLVPRTDSTTVNLSFPTPATGLLIYQTTDSTFYYFDGSKWRPMGSTSVGPAGPTGPQGTAGLTGTTGVQGIQGSTGPTGLAGTNGSIGPTGPQGSAGTNGSIGPTGPQGSAGTNGSIGPTGPQGSAGIAGPTGADGALNAWSLSGNIGTTVGTNFLGTTDVQDFAIYTNNTERLRVVSGGNVGIGTTAPTQKLEVNGRLKTNGINETSDFRMKQDIIDLENSLEKIEQLRGVKYKWKTHDFPEKNFDAGWQIGVIAQEVEKVIPELVKTDIEGYKSVEYSHLIPVLMEAIKEQQKMINTMKKQVDYLKKNNIEIRDENRHLSTNINKIKNELKVVYEIIGIEAKNNRN
ncbi:MAG: hypothetical protein COA57_06290 [Flavobacteriales bacterium]|nr:tail fiber domain-containing protein [Bacteroidales bacterium AH-315-I05]PCJ86331.1 MAG: hypothetical protein COA57_06290 [Flavobacteriales bacterium]